MEPGIYLTGMVFAIGALHLLTRLVGYVSQFYAASALGKARSKKAPAQRDDWYVFFHRSDLTGEPYQKKADKQGEMRPGASPKKSKRPDPRPALRA